VTILRFTVTDSDTALALGSGDVPVLATPRLLAWMEAATVAAASVRVDATSTTVGAEVWMRHRRASSVGAQVEVEVTEVSEQDRGLAFEVVAREVPAAGSGGSSVREIASGRVLRAIVDRGAFLSRL
jgi:fluoroacetyl-CoA thioesterase